MKKLEIMNWQLFLPKLLKDFRLSSSEFEQKTGVSNVTVSNIKNGKTSTPNQNTIQKIEASLNIKIDDSEPENITYQRITPKIEGRVKFDDEVPLYRYPVLANVYAGEPDMLDHEIHDEYEYFTYKKNSHRCFAVRVNGESMETTLRDGDIVLADMDAELTDGCLAVVKLKNGKQYIKRYYNLNFAFIKLSSDNPEYGVRLIEKGDLLACFRAVRMDLAL